MYHNKHKMTEYSDFGAYAKKDDVLIMQFKCELHIRHLIYIAVSMNYFHSYQFPSAQKHTVCKYEALVTCCPFPTVLNPTVLI